MVKVQEGQAQWGAALHQAQLMGIGFRQGQHPLGVGQLQLLLGLLQGEQPQSHGPEDHDKEEEGWLLMAGRPVRNGQRSPKIPPSIPNVEKLKDPKYALALYIARQRRERQGPTAPAR